MKQTAVEWLVEQIKEDSNLRLRGFDIDGIGKQAKEMEKQQKGYSEEDMINFVEFVSKYYSDDLMENYTIYELLEQFKNK